MNNQRAGGLFSLQDQGSSWLARTRPSEDISVKEEIEEEIMEDFEEIAEEIEEDIDEVQEQPSVSDSRENYSYTSFSEAEESEKSDGLQEALEVERRATAALEVALKNEKATKAQHKAALKQERKVKEALATSLRKKEAEKNSLCVEVEHLKVQVDDLKKSQKDQQRSKAKLKGLFKKLQKDLEASAHQHEKDSAERHLVNCAEVKTLKDSLVEQQGESLEKDAAIQSLHFDIQKLQSDIEAKDTIVSTLEEKVKQWASDLNEERTKNCSHQRDYEAAISQQLKEAEELERVTRENQLLASENTRLQSELAAVLNERQLHQKQLQDNREACSRHGEAIEKEKAQSLRAFEKIQIQEKELSERTLALEKSLIGGKLLRSSLRSEKKRFDQMISEKKALVERLAILRDQLRDAAAGSESLMSNMQTLRVENADIRAKFHDMEIKYDRIRSKHHSLSERHEEMTSKKNDTISENHITITKLQCAVDVLKEQRSESKTRQAELEDALKQEKTQRAELEDALKQEQTKRAEHEDALKQEKTQRAELEDALKQEQTKRAELEDALKQEQTKRAELEDALKPEKTQRAELEDALKPEKTRFAELQQRTNLIASALDKERARSEKQRIELKEALIRQIETLELKQTLAVALQKAQNDVSRLQGQQLRESSVQHRHICDAQLRLNQQRNALDESTKALHHLQREYTELGSRHRDINSDYRELLKTHSSLHQKYERLCYAQGNPRLDFSQPQFNQERQWVNSS